MNKELTRTEEAVIALENARKSLSDASGWLLDASLLLDGTEGSRPVDELRKQAHEMRAKLDGMA